MPEAPKYNSIEDIAAQMTTYALAHPVVDAEGWQPSVDAQCYIILPEKKYRLLAIFSFHTPLTLEPFWALGMSVVREGDHTIPVHEWTREQKNSVYNTAARLLDGRGKTGIDNEGGMESDLGITFTRLASVDDRETLAQLMERIAAPWMH